MKTKKKLKTKNRLAPTPSKNGKSAGGHHSGSTAGKPSPNSKTPAPPAAKPKTSSPSSGDAPAKKPNPGSGNSAVSSPFVETQTANGSVTGKRYCCYEFHVDSTCPTEGYLATASNRLANRTYDNVGELVLAIGLAYIYPQAGITSHSMRYRFDQNRVDVLVEKDGNDPVCVGWFVPGDAHYTVQPDGSKLWTGKPEVPAARKPTSPPDPSLLAAARPVKGEEVELPPVQKAEEHKMVLGVEISKSKKGHMLIFGHPATAIARWCGWDAWSELDTFKLFIALGFGDTLDDKVVRKQMKLGASKVDQSRPVPQLTEAQEKALLGVVESQTVKAKKKPK